jgi:TRAP-type C4-dicarboxylate transport system permease small subunit
MEKTKTTIRFLSAFDRGLVFFLRLVCTVCFILLLLLLAGNVFVRYFPVAAFYWFDEVVEWAFAWMVFFGAAALWARNEHFRLEWINEKIKGTRACHLVAAGMEVISLFFILIFFYQAMRLTLLARDWTPVFNVPRRYLYVCMPLSGIIMVAYSIRKIVMELSACGRFPNQTGRSCPAPSKGHTP